MNSLNTALLVNLLGFTVGTALYALLAAMVVRHRKTSDHGGLNFLLLTTGILGLLWNIGELFIYVQSDFSSPGYSRFLTVGSYSALGFLPSVVVHSAQTIGKRAKLLTIAAYILSVAAAVMHFYEAFSGGTVPSQPALLMLTYGSLVLAAGLFFLNFRETLGKRSVWAAALLIFAVSGLHLSGVRTENSWLVELIAHQSSLPLALAILLQNFRFAFADLFLKRAISLLLLALVSLGLYVAVAAPLLRLHETHDRNDVQAISLIIILWIATALVYPAIHRLAVWLVDKIILRRVNYDELLRELSAKIDETDSFEGVLDEVGSTLAAALTAENFNWAETLNTEISANAVDYSNDKANVHVPVAELPQYCIEISRFRGGRRLLSDETAVLEAVATKAARRIDSLRVTNERYEREIREQEFSKLAAEAQLTALRAQINPHFLFNALTTIGYLIQASPDKAFQTLLQLTKLLRGVLSRTAEFSTLAAEIRLIESYLEIESARFEEKLKVSLDIPKKLELLQVPSLILQPLVENAIKHAISENRSGGTVSITARLDHSSTAADELVLLVEDTGAGKGRGNITACEGVGLRTIRERLKACYGNSAKLEITTNRDNGTSAEIHIPLARDGATVSAVSAPRY